MAESFYAFIGLWGLFYKGRYQRMDVNIPLTGKDNATIVFFRNKMMDNRKKVILINYNQEAFKNFLTTT
jgi:hypothetical protein